MDQQAVFFPRLNADHVVHVCDPDLKICEALSLLFRLEGFETQFSSEARELQAALASKEPTVLIANQQVPGTAQSAPEIVRRLKQSPIVVLLQDEPSVPRALAAVRDGAHYVMPKPIDKEELIKVVRAELRRITRVVASPTGPKVQLANIRGISPREREIVELVIAGMTNKEIGLQLHISPRTVEVHRHNAMTKLGAKNSVDMVRMLIAI